MPQIPATKEYNTFVKGLITEASPLTFPEDASQDEDNFELRRKGDRARRLGLDYETSFTLRSTNKLGTEFISDAISIYKWEDVNTDGNSVILVVQVGLDLWFYDATTSTVSDNPLNGGSKLTLEGDKTLVFSFDSISGDLIVATGNDYVYRVEYNSSTDTMSFSRHGILVRDIWGVTDKFSPDFRARAAGPAESNRNERMYNLTNIGWGEPSPDSNQESVSGVSLASLFRSAYGANNSSIERLPNLYDKPQLGYRDDSASYDADFVFSDQTRADLAPVGHLVIDLFNRGSSRPYAASGLNILNNYRVNGNQWDIADGSGNKNLGIHLLAAVSPEYSPTISKVSLALENGQWGLPTDKTTGGVTVVSSFAGRIWYAGFSSEVLDGDSKSPNLASYIAYSQTVENPENIGKCYQKVSPTSATDSALVDTDGGTIKIPGMAKVVKLVPFGRSLLVFATNGVWEIRGGDNGFSATDQIVERITNVGAVNADSIVFSEDRIMYWASQGIYQISREQVTSNFVSSSVTEATIQTLYNSLSSSSKKNVKGLYSGPNRRVIWIYNDESSYDGITDIYRYNRQLTFDLVLGAFYTYTFATDSTDTEYPRVAGLYESPNFISQVYQEPVYVGADPVIEVIYPVDANEADVGLLLLFEGIDGGTTIVDSSPTPKTITVNGDIFTDTDFAASGLSSGYFDGTGDSITHADLLGATEDFTIECWFRKQVVDNRDELFEQGTSGAGSFTIHVTSTNLLRVFLDDGGSDMTIDSTSTISIDTWYHVAVVKDSNTYRLYVNGAEEGTATNSQSIVSATSYIGNSATAGRDFQGWLDFYRITNGVARYSTTFTPPFGSVEDVVVGRSAATGTLTKTSYLAVKPSDASNYTYTFASIRNPEYVDWESDASTSQDAGAYIETGVELYQDSQRKKQIEYITTHLERTETGFDSDLNPTPESSCLMQVKWDFASSSNSTKWGTPYQVYRLRRDYMPSGTADSFDYDQSVISTKNRVRGRGRALSIRFSTEAGKACTLHGWGAKFYNNTDV